MRFTRLPLALLALSLGLAACTEDEEPTGPRALEPLPTETYVAQSIEGAAMPAIVYVAPPVEDDPYSYDVYVLYDTLRLISNGRYEHRARLETRRQDGVVVERSYRNDRGTWRVDGDGLRFESGYIQNVRFTGVRTGNGATLVARQNIVWDAAASEKQFVYARQPVTGSESSIPSP